MKDIIIQLLSIFSIFLGGFALGILVYKTLNER